MKKTAKKKSLSAKKPARRASLKSRKKAQSPRSSALKIKIWGARGSLPSPILPEIRAAHSQSLLEGFFEQGHKDRKHIAKYLKSLPRHRVGGYGGNTPCIEVNSPTHQVII